MRNAYQKDFFEKLAYMQEETVQIALCKYKPGDDVEDLLYEVTYDILAELMTWIDGYGNFVRIKWILSICIQGKDSNKSHL